MQDIDRIFIATNFEEEEQEGNDDRSLCRFEFFEIIVRMARQKYCENLGVPSMKTAVEELLKEILSKNFIWITEEFRVE
jgi:hypothetical protein